MVLLHMLISRLNARSGCYPWEKPRGGIGNLLLCSKEKCLINQTLHPLSSSPPSFMASTHILQIRCEVQRKTDRGQKMWEGERAHAPWKWIRPKMKGMFLLWLSLFISPSSLGHNKGYKDVARKRDYYRQGKEKIGQIITCSHFRYAWQVRKMVFRLAYYLILCLSPLRNYVWRSKFPRM